MGEQNLVQPLTRPQPREDVIDIMARLQAAKPDRALRHFDDLDRLTSPPFAGEAVKRIVSDAWPGEDIA